MAIHQQQKEKAEQLASPTANRRTRTETSWRPELKYPMPVVALASSEHFFHTFPYSFRENEIPSGVWM